MIVLAAAVAVSLKFALQDFIMHDGYFRIQ